MGSTCLTANLILSFTWGSTEDTPLFMIWCLEPHNCTTANSRMMGRKLLLWVIIVYYFVLVVLKLSVSRLTRSCSGQETKGNLLWMWRSLPRVWLIHTWTGLMSFILQPVLSSLPWRYSIPNHSRKKKCFYYVLLFYHLQEYINSL